MKIITILITTILSAGLFASTERFQEECFFGPCHENKVNSENRDSLRLDKQIEDIYQESLYKGNRQSYYQ